MKSLRRFSCDESGAAMVEFALVCALFTAMLMGFLEAGYSAWSRNSVFADAREGARYAMVHGSTATSHVASSDSVKAYVRSKTSLDTVRITTTWPSDNHPGSRVWVHVEHDVARFGPFIPAHLDSSTSKMMIVF